MVAVDGGRQLASTRPGAHARQWPALLGYAALACAISWATWIPPWLDDRLVRPGDGTPSHFPGLLGPMLAAFAVAAIVSGRAGLQDLLARVGRWRVGWRCWLAAFSPLVLAAPVAITLAAIGDGWPGWREMGRLNGVPATNPLVLWLVLLVVNGFGEETGWRGFAIPLLQQWRSPLAASLLLAPLWALWHVPLFFIIGDWQDTYAGTLAGWLFGLACGSVVLAWLFNASGGSVPVVATWHATYNLVVATEAAAGAMQAAVTTLVMAWAIALVILDLRARRAGAPPVIGAGFGQGHHARRPTSEAPWRGSRPM